MPAQYVELRLMTNQTHLQALHEPPAARQLPPQPPVASSSQLPQLLPRSKLRRQAATQCAARHIQQLHVGDGGPQGRQGA